MFLGCDFCLMCALSCGVVWRWSEEGMLMGRLSWVSESTWKFQGRGGGLRLLTQANNKMKTSKVANGGEIVVALPISIFLYASSRRLESMDWWRLSAPPRYGWTTYHISLFYILFWLHMGKSKRISGWCGWCGAEGLGEQSKQCMLHAGVAWMRLTFVCWFYWMTMDIMDIIGRTPPQVAVRELRSWMDAWIWMAFAEYWRWLGAWTNENLLFHIFLAGFGSGNWVLIFFLVWFSYLWGTLTWSLMCLVFYVISLGLPLYWEGSKGYMMRDRGSWIVKILRAFLEGYGTYCVVCHVVWLCLLFFSLCLFNCWGGRGCDWRMEMGLEFTTIDLIFNWWVVIREMEGQVVEIYMIPSKDFFLDRHRVIQSLSESSRESYIWKLHPLIEHRTQMPFYTWFRNTLKSSLSNVTQPFPLSVFVRTHWKMFVETEGCRQSA